MSDRSDTPQPGVAVPPSAPTRPWSAGKAVAEVVLIALGVFLGLAGEQWRAGTERRAQARASLERFRSEIAANQQAIAAVKDYHVETQRHIRAYFNTDRGQRDKAPIRLAGIQPAAFEHTAWDLAIATQALADIDRDIAYALTQAYGQQEIYSGLTRGILQAMYLRPVRENLDAFLASLDTYYGDIVLIEPKLQQMYQDLLPRIDRELGK